MNTPPPDPAESSETAPEETPARLRRTLEQQLAQVDSPETADAVAARLEQLAPDKTEEEVGKRTAAAPKTAAEAVEEAARPGPAPETTAAVFIEAAKQAVAPTREAPAVVGATQRVLTKGPEPEPPEVERGRSLLKEAILHRMGPLQALDTRLYLAVNGFPHAPWSDRLANLVTIWATGGWIWAGGVLVTRLVGLHRQRWAVSELLPSMVLVTWIAEYPIKAVFRRRRPFIDIVRGLVVGKQPGSWSFPSGHTASSFACAWVLSKIWPRRAPLFFALASCVGMSRIYVGAHYPGDVLSGALLGMLLSEVVHRPTRQLLRVYRLLSALTIRL